MSKDRKIDLRYSESVSIGDAMQSYLKSSKLDKKLESVKIIETFMQSLPESFRKDVIKAEFSNGILSVYANSSSFRQNLQMASDSIVETINDKLNTTIVHKLLLR